MFFTTPAEKLQRLTSLFNELPPRFQDYVVTQIEQLLAAIDGESESGNSEATGGSTGQ